MKLSKMLGVLAVAAMALMAFASTASATTLSTNGVKQTGAVEIRGSLEKNTSALLKDTAGAFANTCTSSTVVGKTSTFTGARVSGPISSLAFSGCTHEKVVVHKTGTLSVEWIKGTHNGTLRSNGAEATVPATIFGFPITVTCTTSETDLGTVTGTTTAGASATIDINAVLNCGNSLPSAPWIGSYVTTTSAGANHTLAVVE